MQIKYKINLTLILIMMVGCSGPEPEPADAVAERAQARWKLLIERDFDEAWEYYSPGFRETMDQRDFVYDMERRPVRWRAAQVGGVECEADRCTVTTDVTYNVPGAPSGMSRIENSRPVQETWIRAEGAWWFMPEG